MTAPGTTVGVRAAGPADQAALDSLWSLAHQELRPTKGGQRLFDSLEGPPDISAEDPARTVTLVGLIGTAVVGMVSVATTGPIGSIAALYVAPDAREVGVGHALLEAAADAARQAGCAHLDAVVLPGNRAAKNFFESHSMVTRLLTVAIELTPEP